MPHQEVPQTPQGVVKFSFLTTSPMILTQVGNGFEAGGREVCQIALP
jgi:hypothetical protein